MVSRQADNISEMIVSHGKNEVQNKNTWTVNVLKNLSGGFQFSDEFSIGKSIQFVNGHKRCQNTASQNGAPLIPTEGISNPIPLVVNL